MNSIKTAFIALALVSAPALAEDCSAPEMPAMPDGATSTEAQMIEGMTAVKDFQAANSDYMQCIQQLLSAATEAAAGGEVSDEAKAALGALDAQYNQAVSNEEELAGQFNTELREYKAASAQ